MLELKIENKIINKNREKLNKVTIMVNKKNKATKYPPPPLVDRVVTCNT